MSFDELFDAEFKKLDWLRQENSKILTARMEGEAEGAVKGKAEGKAEGLAEGKNEIARQLLDVLDVQTIAQKTGLTVDEVLALKNEK